MRTLGLADRTTITEEHELSAAAHGFDPGNRAMHATFVAAGPQVRRGLVVKPFANIHVDDWLCAVLKITPAANDGDPAVTRGFTR